tara:strand:+ start:775 stop:1008 length:234 start_codon:yes stop_codon:yes gene_type:complete
MAIFLASTDPTANVEGDQIAMSFKSGDETVTVALSLNQAFILQQHLNRSGLELMRETQRRPLPACAEIIQFRRRAQA